MISDDCEITFGVITNGEIDIDKIGYKLIMTGIQ